MNGRRVHVKFRDEETGEEREEWNRFLGDLPKEEIEKAYGDRFIAILDYSVDE
jgi:hypothetical protein